jgi:hypothetical protein
VGKKQKAVLCYISKEIKMKIVRFAQEVPADSQNITGFLKLSTFIFGL